jgi:hypothetical protein
MSTSKLFSLFAVAAALVAAPGAQGGCSPRISAFRATKPSPSGRTRSSARYRLWSGTSWDKVPGPERTVFIPAERV